MYGDAVAANLLNQYFNPVGQDQTWVGDLIDLKTTEGWAYLTVIMNLYSHHIIG